MNTRGRRIGTNVAAACATLHLAALVWVEVELSTHDIDFVNILMGAFNVSIALWFLATFHLWQRNSAARSSTRVTPSSTVHIVACLATVFFLQIETMGTTLVKCRRDTDHCTYALYGNPAVIVTLVTSALSVMSLLHMEKLRGAEVAELKTTAIGDSDVEISEDDARLVSRVVDAHQYPAKSD